MLMKIPILKHTYKGVKRYRISSLSLPVRFDKPVYTRYMEDPDLFVTRSLEEWSAFFEFDVQLVSPEEQPASIDWGKVTPNFYSEQDEIERDYELRQKQIQPIDNFAEIAKAKLVDNESEAT